MQAEYPIRVPTPTWDPVHLRYPVRKFPETGDSSETIGRRWKDQPEILMFGKSPLEVLKKYMRDYNVTKELTKSQSTKDFGYKAPNTSRINKHTSCTENQYVYPLPKRIAERQPQCSAHAASVMKNSYTLPNTASRLVTDKDQFKHPASLPPDPYEIEPSFHKELPPLDTTQDGFEKLLDPYLTTSRLHHRPFTAEQLTRQSATKDILTYYSFSKDPWVRSPKVKPEIGLPLSRPKTTYDREKFKEGFREIRTHNQPSWVPGSFRTEARDNYRPQSVRPACHVEHLEEDVRNYYHRLVAKAPTNILEEHSALQDFYQTENSHPGSGRPICAVVKQHVQNNKRLDRKSRFVVDESLKRWPQRYAHQKSRD